MSVARLRGIVEQAVPTLFAKIDGGRVPCASEATLQLHLAHTLSAFGDLALISRGEHFTIELEKRFGSGRIDIWCCLTDAAGHEWRCAIELKFFKRENHREPNNRYDVFKDFARLESYAAIADIGYMVVATDHDHYVRHDGFSGDTADFDFRHGRQYSAGAPLTYRTAKPHGPPITLARNYSFAWVNIDRPIKHLCCEVVPVEIAPKP